jgi:hypothetical protein
MDSDTDLISDFKIFYNLTIIYEGPEHGYGILRKFKNESAKSVQVSIPFLQQLEKTDHRKIRDAGERLYT